VNLTRTYQREAEQYVINNTEQQQRLQQPDPTTSHTEPAVDGAVYVPTTHFDAVAAVRGPRCMPPRDMSFATRDAVAEMRRIQASVMPG